MDWSWWFSIKSKPGDLPSPELLCEIVGFLLMLALCCITDVYIIRELETALRVFLAAGANLVIGMCWCIAYAIRHPPPPPPSSSDPVPRKGDLLAFQETDKCSRDAAERKPLDVREHAVQLTWQRCFTLASLMLVLSATITSTVQGMSSSNACAAVEYHDDRYEYAVRAEGTCHPSAQRKTIEDALLHYAEEKLSDSICGVHCLRLSHGGTWTGYVVSGKPTYDWVKYLDQCSSVGKYGQCESGGKEYVKGLDFAEAMGRS